MAGLTVEARASLAQVIEGVPDESLGAMRAAVARMGGERAAHLVQMLEDALDDRRRRATAFDALIPLFRARSDGLYFLQFPASVLPRLWRLAAEREPALLPMLDSLNDENANRRALARSRLYALAAGIVRESPQDVWPASCDAAQAGAREDGLRELASCCDMGVLAHRATRDIRDWIGRPDEERLADVRLAMREAGALDVDGVQRLMNIMAAHIDDAAQLLLLAVHATNGGSGSGARDPALSGVVERILDGFDARAQRIVAYGFGDSTQALRRDLDGCVAVLEAVDAAVRAGSGGDWALRVVASRALVTKMMDERLAVAEATMARALPMRDVQTAGRMTRRVPRLDVDVAEADLAAAGDLADLIAAVRSAACRFGCEGRRQSLLTALTADLVGYAELTLEAIRTGEVPDPGRARVRALQIADWLERLEDEAEARTLRRRIAALRPPSRVVHAA